MTDTQLKIGDTVELKSSGPIMTIVSLNEVYGTPTVHCTWFVDSKKLERGSFPPEALEKVAKD